MDKRSVKNTGKGFFLVNLILGIAFLTAGVLIDSLTYSKALVAISLIPFGLAVSLLYKMIRIRKDPYALVEDQDERVVADRNRADALSLRIIRYISMLGFFIYTFTRPPEIFESLAWWIITVTYLLSILLPPAILGNINKNFKPDND